MMSEDAERLVTADHTDTWWYNMSPLKYPMDGYNEASFIIYRCILVEETMCKWNCHWDWLLPLATGVLEGLWYI